MRFILIAAQSLDGYITRHDTPGSDFASEADRTFFRRALQDFDCCVMGSVTYRTARDLIRTSLMPDRLRVVLTRRPQPFSSDTIPGKLEFSSAPPRQLADELGARGFQSCAILGGSQIHSLFLEAGLIDELWLTVEPLLFGEGTPLLNRRTSTQLSLLSRENLSSDTLLLKYRITK